MKISEAMGTPEFDENGDILIPVADEAFICTRCGTEKQDKTSTYKFCREGVLCDPCFDKVRSR